MQRPSRSWGLAMLLFCAAPSVWADNDSDRVFDSDRPEPRTDLLDHEQEGPKSDPDPLWRLLNRFAGVTHPEQAKALMRGLLRRARRQDATTVLLCDGPAADDRPPLDYEIHPDDLGDLDADSITDLVDSLEDVADAQPAAMRATAAEPDDPREPWSEAPDGAPAGADGLPCDRGSVRIEFGHDHQMVFRFERDRLQLTALRRGPCRDQEMTMTLHFGDCPPSSLGAPADQRPFDVDPQAARH